MNWSVAFRNVTIGAFAGAAVGLIAGLLLVWLTDSVDNPFWVMAIGIAIGAAMSQTTPMVKRDLQREPDRDQD